MIRDLDAITIIDIALSPPENMDVDLNSICPNFEWDVDGVHVLVYPGTADIIVQSHYDWESQLLDMWDLGVRGTITTTDGDSYRKYEFTNDGIVDIYGHINIEWTPKEYRATLTRKDDWHTSRIPRGG